MRLITFEIPSPQGRLRRAGALDTDGSAIDLSLASQSLCDSAFALGKLPMESATLPHDLLELIRGGLTALDTARAAIAYAQTQPNDDHFGRRLRHPVGTFRLLAPLPRPPSLRDFLVVEEHVRNARKQPPPEEWFNLPVYYKGNVDAVFGPDDEIPWPRYTEKLDYELELCAVIGTLARDVTADQALDHVVGFTIFNDWSARDIQRREMSVGLGPALGKDFANSLGPSIVTRDEFDESKAAMRAIVDGELWSEGTLAGMHFSFSEIIEWISMEQTLHPGDLLGSGTIGRGCGLELNRWIRPGSVVELEVDGIGILRNRVGPIPQGGLVLGPRMSDQMRTRG